MELSNDLLSQFAKVTNDKKETKKESTVYGTVTSLDGQKYVMMDGSELATPCDTTMDVGVGDRVVVQIKNHTATITGNMSSPAVKEESVSGIVQNEVSGTFDKLEAGYAEIDNLKAGYAEIDTLKAGYAEIDTLKAGYAEIDTLKAGYAEIDTLKAGYADITDLKADFADIKTLTVEDLAADYAFIKELDAKEIDTESIDADFANIVFANVEEAHIDNLFAKYGMIEVIDGVDGTFTRNLIGVNVIGDTIQANNLVVKGENGIYYKLNIDHMGKATADELTEEEKEKLKNGLLGDVIVAHSITADKISVTDLKAFGATIGGFTITDDAIHTNAKGSVDATTHGIYLDNDGQMAIGNNADQYIRYSKQDDGSYKLDIEADSIFIKTADKDVDISEFGTRLDIAETTIAQNADEIALKASRTYVGEAVDGINIGARNLLLNTSDSVTLDASGGATNRYQKIPMSVEKLEEGQTYTFTANVNIASGSSDVISIALYNANISKNDSRATLTIENGRVSGQIIPGASGESFLVYAGKSGSTAGNVITFSNMKLEKGNKATDWSPAPEDYYTKAQTQAELNVKAEEITSTVSGTYATKDDVKDVKTLVTQTAEKITSTVSANYPTKNDVTTQINQTAEEITSTASTTYATKGEVKAVETLVTQTAEGISATVTSSVKTAVDGIEIGGRNLVKNTNSETPILAAYELFELTDYGIQNVKNKKVTASFEAFTTLSSNVDINCYLRYIDPETGAGTSVDKQFIYGITNKWQKFSVTFDTSSAGDNDIKWLAIADGTTTADVRVRNVKVETGDKATDWTLAPEDYFTKEQTQAELKILSDSITSTVNKTTALEEGLEAAESRITQTANSITSTVESAVTGLTIGGRNLILTPDALLSNDSYLSIEKTSYQKFSLTDYGVTNIKNKKVTASFEAISTATTGDFDCYLRYENASGSGVSVDRKYLEAISSWQRFSATLDASLAEDNTIIEFAIRNSGSSNYINVRNVKLEIGDKATDWSLAPEQMASKTELTQTNNALTLRIDSAEKTATDFFEADSSGFTIGDFREETSTLGNNVLIGSDNVSIRNGTTVNSKFTGDSIELGRNSKTATADILGGAFKIKYTTEIDTGGFGVYGKTKAGHERLAFQPINENGNLTLGYGGYAAAMVNTSGDTETKGASGTNIWGNRIYLRSAENMYIIPKYTQEDYERYVFLTGHLQLDNTYHLYGSRADGTKTSLANVNSDNNVIFGFGSKNQKVGTVYYQGNSVVISSNKNVTLAAQSTNLVQVYKDTSYTTFRPVDTNTVTLGLSGVRWKEIYTNAAAVQTSDRNVKTDINNFDERYEALFTKLKPCKYKFVNGTSGRTHSGFISQDVEEALSEVDLTALDFAAFCRDKKTQEVEDPETGEITRVEVCDENGNPEYEYSLRYEEFIALNTHMIQKLQSENQELKDKLSSLEERLAKLETLCGGDTNGS